VVNPPRTLKEEVTAKRERSRLGQLRRAEHAADDFNGQVEEERKSKVEIARAERLKPYDDRLSEIDHELALPGLVSEVRDWLEEKRDEVLEARGRIDQNWRP
jgi:hypothetical protein